MTEVNYPHILDPFELDDSFSLTLVRRDSELLLGRKTRGFGKGLLVAPGGKNIFDPRARIGYARERQEAARREVREETGIDIVTDSFREAGQITRFDSEMESSVVTIYEAEPARNAQARDSEELVSLTWYPETDIPYDWMHADYQFWLPAVLAGCSIDATFFDKEDGLVHGNVIHQQVHPTLERARRFDIVNSQAVSVHGLMRVPRLTDHARI